MFSFCLDGNGETQSEVHTWDLRYFKMIYLNEDQVASILTNHFYSVALVAMIKTLATHNAASAMDLMEAALFLSDLATKRLWYIQLLMKASLKHDLSLWKNWAVWNQLLEVMAKSEYFIVLV